MEIRLIAADMDGTLLDDEKGIPEENLRAFRACAAQGIEIVPATGRTMRGLPDELRNLPGVHYAILTNGAHAVDAIPCVEKEIPDCDVGFGYARLQQADQWSASI